MFNKKFSFLPPVRITAVYFVLAYAEKGRKLRLLRADRKGAQFMWQLTTDKSHADGALSGTLLWRASALWDRSFCRCLSFAETKREVQVETVAPKKSYKRQTLDYPQNFPPESPRVLHYGICLTMQRKEVVSILSAWYVKYCTSSMYKNKVSSQMDSVYLSPWASQCKHQPPAALDLSRLRTDSIQASALYSTLRL